MDLLVATRTDRKIGTKARPAEAAIGRLVEGVLRRSGYLALRDVSCVAVGQALYLRGRLPSYYLKQVAQESVASVAARAPTHQLDRSVHTRGTDASRLQMDSASLERIGFGSLNA